MTVKADHDVTALVAEVSLMRAQQASMAEENGQLRNEVAQLRSAVRQAAGRDLEPVIHRSTHTGPAWEDIDPRHDPDFIAAFTKYGLGSGEAKSALDAARQRIAARENAMPGRLADFERADKNRNQSMDLAGLPVAPGGVMTRDAQTGQVHVRYRAEVTCSAGHPAHEGKPFCPVCGSAVAAVAIGEGWPGNDPDEDRERDHVLDDLVAERIREEA
jgi:hypothetical protein